MSSLQLGVDSFHSVDKESCFEVVHTPLREGGVLTALGAGEWLASAFPQSQLVDALFAEVVAAREDLGLIIMLTADGTRDLLLQLLHTFLYHHFIHLFSHDIKIQTRK